MKTTLLTLLLLICLPACASWSTSDKWLAAGMVGGQAADYAISQDRLSGGGYKEVNGLMGDSSGQMAAIKIGATGLTLWLADTCPKYRKHILLIGNVFGWGAFTWNASQ